MGFLWSKPEPPLTGKIRCHNIIKNNFRGLIGSIPIIGMIIFLFLYPEKMVFQSELIALLFYFMFLWCLVFQPVALPVTALMAFFGLVLVHLISTPEATSIIFPPTVALMIIGGYLRQLLNCSGADRRFICWFLNNTDPKKKLSTYKLLFRVSAASYIISIFSDQLLAVPYIMEIISKPLINSQSNDANKLTHSAIRYILCNAVVTSSVLGSLTVVNGNWSTLVMRILWEMRGQQDTFNFMDYTAFAFPTTLVMFIVNFLVNLAQLREPGRSAGAEAGMLLVSNSLSKAYKDLPNSRRHETLTIMFVIIHLAFYFGRWGTLMHKVIHHRGWCDFQWAVSVNGMCIIPDATVSAIFVLLLCVLPLGKNFMDIWFVEFEKDKPPLKPESAILTWRYIDKNSNYSYYLLTGAFIVLDRIFYSRNVASFFFGNVSGAFQHEDVGQFLILVMSVVACNFMSSVAAAGMLFIMIMNLTKNGIDALPIGMGCALNFASPFLNNPSYFSKSVGKVHLGYMIRYSLPSLIFCTLILFGSLKFYAKPIFEPGFPVREFV